MTQKTVIAVGLILLAGASAASAQGQPAAPAQPEVQATAPKLAGNVYAVDGQGGRISALVGPDGVLLVDSQFPQVTEKISHSRCR